MRALGSLFIGVGALLVLIAWVWGRSGYYVSQAPILFALVVGALISLGIGAGTLRYRKAGLAFGRDSRTPVAGRASETTITIAALPLVEAIAPSGTDDSASTGSFTPVNEMTLDRPPRTTDWVLVLPDTTVLPIADALVIGRQPVASDGGPTAAVPSPEVSKSHARFSIVEGQLWVRDLDTTNGTVIVHSDDSEERASSVTETILRDGDHLEIGSYSLEIEHRL